MKKLLTWLLSAVMVVLLLPMAPAQAATDTPTTFVLSNEAGGYLIDQLIATGHGDDTMYEIMQLLRPLSGGVIPADFMAALAATPGGSEVKTVALSNFAGLNNPVCINTDGTLSIEPIFGRDLDGHDGYTSLQSSLSGVGSAWFTAADNPAHYVNAGEMDGQSTTRYYKAFAVAWMPDTQAAGTPTTFVLSNEEGGLIDKLVAAGHGDDSLYKVLQLLKPISGGAISDEFMASLAAAPAGSDVKTAALKYYTGLNNPVGINTDGTLIILPVFGRDYFGQAGYSSYPGALVPGSENFIKADSPAYYIDSGSSDNGGDKTTYFAFAIAWMPTTQDAPDTWALPEVREAEQRKLVPAELQSDYTKTVTRSEFCSLAVLCVEQVKQMTVDQYIAAQHLTLPAASPFADIAGLPQKEQADILAAFTLKIVSGTSPTTFNPSDKITREQAAKMLTSAAAALGKTTEAALPTFADGGQISSWAAPYIGYVYNAKIMNGVGDNRFDPSGGYQRQQAYMTMLRLYKYVTGAV